VSDDHERMQDEATHTAVGRLPSYITDYTPRRLPLALIFVLSAIAATDLFTPLPGVLAIALAVPLYRRRVPRARVALALAALATAIGAVQYAWFLAR
jgi:hypothetical protein